MFPRSVSAWTIAARSSEVGVSFFANSISFDRRVLSFKVMR